MIRVRVNHTCTTHDARVAEFAVERVVTLTDGGHRYEMTRCDGSGMHAYDDEIELIGEAP